MKQKAARVQLVGQFLVIAGLSAMLVMWAVNSVHPILQSSITTPILGVLLALVGIGTFFHVKST